MDRGSSLDLGWAARGSAWANTRLSAARSDVPGVSSALQEHLAWRAWHPGNLEPPRRGTWGTPLRGMLGKLLELPSNERGSIHWVC